MRKLGLLIIPIITASFLTNCGKETDNYKPLEEYGWKEIDEVSQTGKASEWFKVGDTKTIKVNDVDHQVKIIGFNHDKDKNGNDIGITFEFVNVITDPVKVTINWNYKEKDSSKNYDYRQSTLNDLLNDTTKDNCIFNKLPEDLRNVIKPVDKKVGVSTDKGSSYTATSFEENKYPKLFPLAHDEITKTHEQFVTNEEGTIYEYYKLHDDDTSRTKKAVGGSNAAYWLRSPRVDNGGVNAGKYAWTVNNSGVCVNVDCIYNTANAIAPAFCI